MKFKLATLGMSILLGFSAAAGQTQYRLKRWHWWNEYRINSVLRDVAVVAVGEVVSMREAAGIKVRSSPLMYRTDHSQIMTIRIASVLEGKGLVVPGSIVEALVFPQGGGCAKVEEARDVPHLRITHETHEPHERILSSSFVACCCIGAIPSSFDRTHAASNQGEAWPDGLYPKIALNEPQIFFLDRVRARDPRVDESTGVTEVTGITRYHVGKNFYVYAWSLEAEPLLVSAVTGYAEINNIRDAERRGEELLAFSLSLIEDSQMPEGLLTGVTVDFGALLSWEKPGFKWLTESRVEKLIAVAVHMANLSHRLGRPVLWDAAMETVV